MSDPLSDRCLYCGSAAVLDDAWFCGRLACWSAYEAETDEGFREKLRACGLTDLVAGDPDRTDAA